MPLQRLHVKRLQLRDVLDVYLSEQVYPTLKIDVSATAAWMTKEFPLEAIYNQLDRLGVVGFPQQLDLIAIAVKGKRIVPSLQLKMMKVGQGRIQIDCSANYVNPKPFTK